MKLAFFGVRKLQRQSQQRMPLLFFVLCLVCAIGLRLRLCFTDLWFDEVWSLYNVLTIASPVEIFTRLRIDNNHPLVSFYLYLLGLGHHWVYYRLLSVVTGIGSIVLLWRIALQDGQRKAAIVLLLASFSFLFILYASEARGYAPAGFFCLMAYLGLSTYLQENNWKSRLLYTLGGICSVLSSLTAVIALTSFLLWSGTVLLRKVGRQKIFREFFSAHALLLVLLLFYYLFFVRQLGYGGGTDFTYLNVAIKFFSFSFGLRATRYLTALSCILFFFLYFLGLYVLYQKKNFSQIFLQILIFPIIPACFLVCLQQTLTTLYIRYFFICLPFLFLLWGEALTACWKKGWLGKGVCSIILFCYIAGNAWTVSNFLATGDRGHYYAAVRSIVDKSSGTPITVTSDHTARNELMLQFYASYIPKGPKITYIPQNKLKAPPLWYIEHKFDPAYQQKEQRIKKFGAAYTFVRQFPYAYLSGWHWLLFKREEPQP